MYPSGHGSILARAVAESRDVQQIEPNVQQLSNEAEMASQAVFAVSAALYDRQSLLPVCPSCMLSYHIAMWGLAQGPDSK